MYIYEMIILCVVLATAAICEKLLFNINPYIWILGGLSGLLVKLTGKCFCTWIEALLSLAVLFVVITLLSSKIHKGIGGGILKGIMMTSVFFGRYIIVLVIAFIALLYLRAGLSKKKASIPGQQIISGVPMLFLASAITIASIYLVAIWTN